MIKQYFAQNAQQTHKRFVKKDIKVLWHVSLALNNN